MWEEVRRLNRELDVTIFLTTQYLEEADELADRVGIIHGGRLVAEGTPEELKRWRGCPASTARRRGATSSPHGGRRRGDHRSRGGGPERRRPGASPDPPRELETVIPPIFIALFFFVVNTGTLQRLTESSISGFDIKAFMLPTSVLLGVTGVSRAGALVLDIQNGYFDRLLLTPVRRLAILVGHMLADVAIACTLLVPILVLALSVGVRLETGLVGAVVFVLVGCLSSLAFAAFGYAIALKTGNPAAVNSSFLLFFPFLFMTSSYVPREQLSGWLKATAAWNPVTYIFEGLRSLVTQGWEWDSLAKAVLAIAVVGLVSMSLCLAALQGRTRRG